MKHIWSVLCKTHSIDKATNSISLFNVIEQIQADVEVRGALPLDKAIPLPLDLTLVTFWERSERDVPESGQMRLRIREGEKELGGGTDFQVDLTEHLRSRTALTVPAVPVLPGDGLHALSWSVQVQESGEWLEAASIPLDLQITTKIVTDSPSTEQR